MTTASTAAIATPTTATTPTAPTPAGTEGTDGAEAGGAFTALLAAALGEATPEAVAEVLDGLQEVAGAGATAEGEGGEGEAQGQDGVARGEELSPRALVEAIAAITGNTHLLRGLRGSGEAAGGVAAPEADQPPAGATAATEEGAVPAPAVAEGTGAAVAATTARPVEGRVVGTLPSGPSASPEVEGEAARILHAVRTTAPAATATATTLRPEAEASPTGSSSGEPGSVAPAAVSTASPATVAAPAPARAPDAATHARLVSLVIEAAEALENAPPPRRMVVEVPGSDGLRLQVALRGTEVHVNVQSSTGGPDLGAWGRELASSLATRGMTLGGFQTGTDGQPGQRHGAPGPDHPVPPDDQATEPRHDGRTVRDDELRL